MEKEGRSTAQLSRGLTQISRGRSEAEGQGSTSC